MNSSDFTKLLLQVETNDPKLVNLNLWSCGQSNRFLSMLFDHLSTNHVIKSIDLGNNGFNDEDFLLLCRALLKNRTVAHLCLSFNSITDKGIKHLLSLLKTNKTVHSIDLSRNQITDEGGKRLLSGLRQCRSVYEIDLFLNQISTKLLDRLGFVLGIRRKKRSRELVKSSRMRRRNNNLRNRRNVLMKQNMRINQRLRESNSSNKLRERLGLGTGNQSESESEVNVPVFSELGSELESMSETGGMGVPNVRSGSRPRFTSLLQKLGKEKMLSGQSGIVSQDEISGMSVFTNTSKTLENSESGMRSESLFEDLISETSDYYSGLSENELGEETSWTGAGWTTAGFSGIENLDPLSELDNSLKITSKIKKQKQEGNEQKNENGNENENENGEQQPKNNLTMLEFYQKQIIQYKVILGHYLNNETSDFAHIVIDELKKKERSDWSILGKSIRKLKEENQVLKELNQLHRRQIRSLKSNVRVLQKGIESGLRRSGELKVRVKMLQKTSKAHDDFVNSKK
eukprot:Anaeramoba_flamelloidesa809452_75.p1 GENE.a809452_75~~a809452_75.p1  ORF type:complete len:515 (+),score=125.29 a809452_75:112-1656(+)